MMDLCPYVSVPSYNTVLAGYSGTPHVQEAKQVFDSMHYRNLVSWLTMLSMYTQSDSIREARHLFGEMPERNLAAFHIMLGAFARKELLEDAKSIYDKIPEKTIESWCLLVAGFSQHGHFICIDPQYFEQVDDAVRNHEMFKAYAQIRHPHKSKHYFDHLQTRDSDTWTQMLPTSCVDGELWKQRQTLFVSAMDMKTVRKEDVSPL
ncbi:hypothetical protein SELMODRAFT_412417 [Selaginella moellendorffii]|uniref:Pentatricopeptide repeat-containing protein n=1 Tax=Selaginella moellendorffii TaxID=88036 RepID=D8RL32_SELML|nr:hypothetical protein SELMODRAFT_412417 [Selaginella moellendorffii]